jgi:hypothetical protein
VSSSGFCAELSPEIGITGTPVIDPSTGTIYVVAKTKENGTHVQRLHAIDIATHAEKFGGPVVIRASVAGTGAASQNGRLTFGPVIHLQRSGLLLQNGQVIISRGAHCDKPGFHGWVMSYNAATLSQEGALAIDPDGLGGGVWMSGAGVAADASSNIYFATGNGDYNGSSNFGDSILKLKGGLSFSLLDWFTPYNQATMNANDYDLGSGGVLLLPDLPSGFTHRQLLVQVGKLGTVYLIDRNRMGRYCSTCTNTDTQIVQELYHVVRAMWGMPAYWNGNVYFGGSYNGTLEAFAFNANDSGLLSTSPMSQSVQSFNYPGITPSISAQGTSRGIVWGLENATFASSCCQVLHAYDATNLAVELYNSKQAPNSRDVPGGAVKFAVPIVANGKVYVGSQASLSIYGPLAATPTFSPGRGHVSHGAICDYFGQLAGRDDRLYNKRDHTDDLIARVHRCNPGEHNNDHQGHGGRGWLRSRCDSQCDVHHPVNGRFSENRSRNRNTCFFVTVPESSRISLSNATTTVRALGSMRRFSCKICGRYAHGALQ